MKSTEVRALARQVRALARRYGVQLSYEDATGKRREASLDALRAILDARIGAEPEPVHVVWDGRDVPRGEIELEDGGMWSRDTPLPHGYHSLNDELLIHAPREAHPIGGKTWGMFLPLYAAHTRRSWPEGGDLGDLQAYLDWTRELGGSVVATLPMLAAFDDERSPYSPVSRLFWNEQYLDVDRLPEFQVEDRQSCLSPEHGKDGGQAGLPVLHSKRRALERCAARFVPDADFERFASRANDYARFRAERDGRDTARYHLYVQYRMAQQMRALAGKLYLDFPLGVNGGGYDVHRYPDAFAKGVSVGAPPDAFFTKGQNWGFPPLHPDGMRANRYEYLRAAIRHHVSHASILRLDHVMGLHRLYWIPEGADAKDGVYVRYPDEELFAILTLESRRHECALVGEDLGTVPEYVPRAMKRHGLRRMYVVQYEAQPKKRALPDPPRESVASVNTHDMPTFTAFWRGLDIDDRVELGLLDDDGAKSERDTRAKMRDAIRAQLGIESDDEPAVVKAMLDWLAASNAEVVLINLEDLWGETQPQNVPGVPERSWKQRFRLSLEESQALRDFFITRR